MGQTGKFGQEALPQRWNRSELEFQNSSGIAADFIGVDLEWCRWTNYILLSCHHSAVEACLWPEERQRYLPQWALPTIPMVNIPLLSSLIVTIGNYFNQHENSILFCANASIDLQWKSCSLNFKMFSQCHHCHPQGCYHPCAKKGACSLIDRGMQVKLTFCLSLPPPSPCPPTPILPDNPERSQPVHRVCVCLCADFV